MHNIKLKAKPIVNSNGTLDLPDDKMLKLYNGLKKTDNIFDSFGFSLEIIEKQIVIKDEFKNELDNVIFVYQKDEIFIFANTSKGILEYHINFSKQSIKNNIKLSSIEHIDIIDTDEETTIDILNKNLLGTNNIDLHLMFSSEDIGFGIKPSHSTKKMIVHKISDSGDCLYEDELEIIISVAEMSIPGLYDYLNQKYNLDLLRYKGISKIKE